MTKQGVMEDWRADDSRSLVIAFKTGSDRAFEEIYRQHLPAVQGICRRLLRDREEASDAVQETMLRAFKALPRFNGRYLLGAWLARIATNVCLDMLRRRGRGPAVVPVPDTVLHSVARDEGDLLRAGHPEADAQMFKALDRLPSHYRSGLVLREIEGASHLRIAVELSLTPSAVKALLHRARRQLRREWRALEAEHSRESEFWPA